jgi:hypothetical protein
MHVEMRNAYKNLLRKPEGKGLYCRWENNTSIQMGVKEMGFKGGGHDSCNPGKSSVVGKVMNLWVP